MSAALSIDALSGGYGALTVFRNATIEIASDRVLGILGRQRLLGAVSGLLGGRAGIQAVRVWLAASRPSSETDVSRILNFCTLPVTVIGKLSVTRT